MKIKEPELFAQVQIFGGGQHSLRSLLQSLVYNRQAPYAVPICTPAKAGQIRHGSFSPKGSRPMPQVLRHKKRMDSIAIHSFYWRRTWDSNPRGCYTLLAFQASSLATRSILHMANCCFLFSSATVNRLPHMATLCKQNFLFFCIFLFCGRKLPSEPCRKQSQYYDQNNAAYEIKCHIYAIP